MFGLKAQKTTVQKETTKPVADSAILKANKLQTPNASKKTQKEWKVAPAIKKSSTEIKYAPAIKNSATEFKNATIKQ